MVGLKSSTPLPIRRAIDLAHRQHAKELSLRQGGATLNLHLTQIPPEVLQLDQLERLDLSHNTLQSLPETLHRMSRLQVLDIRNNPIRTLPDGPLPGLIVDSLQLELWGDLFRDRTLHGLQVLPRHKKYLNAYLDRWGAQLRELDLSDCRLGQWPAAVSTLPKLDLLRLWNNQLRALPEEIGQLATLATLDLASNRLHTLPDGLTRLTALTTLDLAGNELTTLPDAFTQLGALTTLNLAYNQLKSLPDSLTQLPRLTTLDLKGNPLLIPPDRLPQLFAEEHRLRPGGTYPQGEWTTATPRPALSA